MIAHYFAHYICSIGNYFKCIDGATSWHDAAMDLSVNEANYRVQEDAVEIFSELSFKVP